MKKAHIDRLQRWSLLLQQANILVKHISGTHNIVGDLLSRWGYFGPHRENHEDEVPKSEVRGLIAFSEFGQDLEFYLA